MAPWFSVARLSLLDRGIAWALVHPRGGGELGRSWYLDGKLLNKRNTFTDTLAASDHLVGRDFADGSRLAIRGGSAGGLLVGACVTMRPGALPRRRRRGSLRRRRHHDERPVASADRDRVGGVGRSPSGAVRQLHRSVLAVRQHGGPPAYPAIFVTAGLNDPRVSYHEPAKWVARLRSVGAGVQRPLVLRTEMGAGHGGRAGATRPGATRRGRSRSCCRRTRTLTGRQHIGGYQGLAATAGVTRCQRVDGSRATERQRGSVRTRRCCGRRNA